MRFMFAMPMVVTDATAEDDCLVAVWLGLGMMSKLNAVIIAPL